MENRIHGDVSIRVDPSRECVYGAESIQAKTPNTFGDAFTVLTGTTLRFKPRDLGLKNYSMTPPKSDKTVREKTQHLGNSTLLKPQGPQAPNLGHHR